MKTLKVIDQMARGEVTLGPRSSAWLDACWKAASFVKEALSSICPTHAPSPPCSFVLSTTNGEYRKARVHIVLACGMEGEEE